MVKMSKGGTTVKPILFSTPMVQAILRGEKTQTRRIKGLEIINQNPDDWQFEWYDYSCKLPWRFTQKSSVNKQSLKERSFNQEAIKCPDGKVGDVLWVRETYTVNNGQYPTDLGYVFKAELGKKELEYAKELGVKWKPSIFMPRAACRIKIEITNIRIERLNGISEQDAIAEGIKYLIDKVTGYCGYDYINGGYNLMTGPFKGYKSLWESINGKGSFGSQWVWVIEFKVV